MFAVKPMHRMPSAAVARRRVAIKRRLRRLGLTINPAISTRELIQLARAASQQ